MSLSEKFQKFAWKCADLMRSRKTVLRHAIEHDDWATAGKILQADKKAMDWEYATVTGIEKPIHLAARNGAFQILTMMANPNFGVFPVDAPTSNGLTPLMIALGNGHDLAAKLFLARGAEIHATGRHGSVLCCAVSGGSIPLADLLLSKGVVLNETDPAIGSPLMVAAYAPNNLPMLEFLLDKGADPNIRGGGIEALKQCLHAPNPDGFRLLLARGAKIDLADQEGCVDLLNWAVMARHPDIVETLLDRGIDPFLRNDQGKTSLEVAEDRCPQAAEVIRQHVARKETEARNKMIDEEVGLMNAGLPQELSVKTIRLRNTKVTP